MTAGAFCTLCGHTDEADLGQVIGICLDKDACHQRQLILARKAGAREERERIGRAPWRREALGALVREVWIEWAEEQPDPKPSWLTGWEDLDAGQREVDMRIGATVAAAVQAAERAKLALVFPASQFRKMADWFDDDDRFKEAMFPETWPPGTRVSDLQQDLRRFADLLDGKP